MNTPRRGNCRIFLISGKADREIRQLMNPKLMVFQKYIE